MRIRVLIADHHRITREGLRIALTHTDDVEVVGTAASGEEAIQVVQSAKPDVIFMDVRMPGMSGIQATRVIRERHPDTKVIVFTVDESRASIAEAIQAGVSGYLLKDVGVSDLVNAARLAMQGKAVIHPSLTKTAVEEVPLAERNLETPLSPLEVDILQLVSYGATTKEAADLLGISFHTVKTHLERIFEKLGAEDRALAIGGDSVHLCRKHRCCYTVIVRQGAGLPLNRAGEWHFTWYRKARVWRLRYPARRLTVRRPVPKGVSPLVALSGGIPGKGMRHIAEQIKRLGFPPPGCTREPSRGQHLVSVPTESDRNPGTGTRRPPSP
jgi:DNA-binding NarL/FixJ family response regulator